MANPIPLPSQLSSLDKEKMEVEPDKPLSAPSVPLTLEQQHITAVEGIVPTLQ
jgi:transcription initiation factor TFIID TATA-box-binding protein